MKNAIGVVCLSFLLASCSGLKFIPHYDDVDYSERNGNIKYVEYIGFYEETPDNATKIGIEYNEKNLPSKQIDFGKGKRSNQEVTLIYDDKLRLIEQLPNSLRAPWHYKYSYDANNNLINQKALQTTPLPLR